VSSKKKIISIIDDDQDTSRLFRMVLSEQFAGYDVFSFNDSVLAVDHFTENQSAYALVITDFRMVGLNGLELLKKVKIAKLRVRTILMSAYNLDEDPAYLHYVRSDYRFNY
jgi:DNA-binding NtrC family response regulator